jgi:hypothetical protein
VHRQELPLVLDRKGDNNVSWSDCKSDVGRTSPGGLHHGVAAVKTAIIISGALANKADSGGEAWVRLSYVLGFRRLGLGVHFVEQVARDHYGEDMGAYFDEVVEQFGLAGAASLIDEHGEPLRGPEQDDLLELAAEAELLVNVSGNLSWQPLLERFRRRAFVDLDPGFTQSWHAEGAARLEGHDVYFTVGENIGKPDCTVPTDGIAWRPTRAPVVLDQWPVAAGGQPERFTTVANWRGFGPVELNGRRLGAKVHEFRKFVELPERARGDFELALNIHPADERDRLLLERHGWRLVDPGTAAATPDAFRSYVQGSGAEFSVAQGVYVDTDSGWFSDRTTRYLASGKPVLVQDTGFTRNLPAGEGLLAFRTLDEAVAGAGAIASDYERHSRAARAIAEQNFDSDKVLIRLLEEAGVA